MASAAGGSTGWLRGRVKAVPSGDSLVIVGGSKPDTIPPEKTITLSSLITPKLARRGSIDEPYAWASREFLRKLCIGKEVTFKVDYTVPSIGREFGSVFLGDKNVALLVVGKGWAKVREQKGEASPFLAEMQHLEGQARDQGLGLWSKVPGAAEASIRSLPPSALGDSSNFDAMGFLAANKGKPLEAIVDQIRDGSTLRVYLLPDFQFVQVFVAGIQAPSMGRRGTQEVVVDSGSASDVQNGGSSVQPQAPLTSAQRLAASSVSITEVSPDPFGREAKHFAEMRVLHREVRIVLEGVDKFSNLIGSVYYQDGDVAKDLALELVENGLAKYVEWSASLLEEDVKRKLKNVELQSKKARLKLWTNYVPPATNSKAIHDQNFTGKVVEIVSGDCIVVADDAVPFGDPSAERRVNLSSIRCPKMGNPRRDEKPAPYAREAKEFLRQRLLGQQVQVSMEYSRKVTMGDAAAPTAGADKVMDFGSVFFVHPAKEGDVAAAAAAPAPGTQPLGNNLAELLVARGFATVIRHRDFEERSNYYDDLLGAESRAIAGKKGIHSAKDPPVMHITDLMTATAKKTKDFLPFLQRNRRMPAVVEYVLSGHRFKLLVPKETCSIAFSLSGVRCPGRGEPYSEEAIAFMRRKIMQRDVEIEVETVDRTGTFIGSLWLSRSNMGVAILQAGLAKLQTSFGADRLADAHLLAQAEQSAKRQKLKIWENYVEGEDVPSADQSTDSRRKKEELKVVVTEVLGGGKFYVQSVADQNVSSIQRQLANLTIQEAPVLGTFNPKKGDLVLAQFSADNSWNRAMIVNAPKDGVRSPNEEFEVFYIDYGNQEVVPYSRIRPIDSSISGAPGLAQLCSLAYMKVPNVEDNYGEESAVRLSELLLSSPQEFRAIIEDRDFSGGKAKGQGTGTVLMVTLFPAEEELSINASMLQDGLARLEKRRMRESIDRKIAMDELEVFQTEAMKKRYGMWEYGHIESDDEDGPPIRKAAGKR